MSGLSTPFAQEYAYGFGRIGVLQQHLLSEADMNRLLGAHSDKELTQILTEIKFTAPVMPLNSVHDLVPAMERWLRKEVEAMAPEGKKEVFHILWLREDIPTIAFFLKKYHHLTSELSIEPKEAVTSYDLSLLRSFILEEKQEMAGNLPKDFVAFIKRMQTLSHPTPQEIDTEVARFVAQKQLQLAQKSGSTLIRRYVSHLIDLQNLRTAQRLGKEENGRKHFVEGGEIDPDLLARNIDDLGLLLQRSSLPDSVLDRADTEENSSLALERGLNRGLAHDIAEMRGIPLSIEPVFAFAIIALSHILLIRTILIGKAAHLSAQEIGTMLPPFFSTSFANA